MTSKKRSYPNIIKIYLTTACVGLMTSTGYAAPAPATSNLVDKPMLPDTAIKRTNNAKSYIDLQQLAQQSVSEPTRPAILRPTNRQSHNDITASTQVTPNRNSTIILPVSQSAPAPVSTQAPVSTRAPAPTPAPNTTAKAAAANSEQLPNAYELVKRLEQQKLEMAKMVNNVEELKMEISDLKRLAKTPSPHTTERDLIGKVSSELQPIIQSQVEAQINSKLSEVSISINPLNAPNATVNPKNTSVTPNSQRPYLNPPTVNNSVQSNQNAANSNSANATNGINSLYGNSQRLTNADIPRNSQISANTSSSNPVTQPLNTQSQDKNAKLAYAAAYSALKENGVQAGVQQMQYFINTYPNHRLIPNAHYWLGEFYLKFNPPKAQLSKQQFNKVITTYKNHDGNNKQSKALYRLATLSKNEGLSSQARTYITTLFREYPDSKEAKLANAVTW